MKAWLIPKASSSTLRMGARQLVVQLAFEYTVEADATLEYPDVLTLYTNVGASLDGADIKTFFALPFFTCAEAAAVDRNLPVHSATYSTSSEHQSIFSILRSEINAISCPLMDKFPFSRPWTSSGPCIILERGPWVESWVNRSIRSSIDTHVWLMATI